MNWLKHQQCKNSLWNLIKADSERVASDELSIYYYAAFVQIIGNTCLTGIKFRQA